MPKRVDRSQRRQPRTVQIPGRDLEVMFSLPCAYLNLRIGSCSLVGGKMIFRISIRRLRWSKVTESVVGGWGRLALLSTSYPELCDIGQVTIPSVFSFL